MCPSDFAEAVEVEIRARGGRLDRSALQEFVTQLWDVILDDPDPARWAQVFADGTVQATA